MIIFRWLKRVFLFLLLSILVYTAVVLLLYQDKPADVLQQSYGVENLQAMQLTGPLDGQTVYYEDTGQGQPIVLIHSHFFTMQMWQPWIAPLSKHFRVIRYDLTSHGLTGPQLNNDYSMQADLAMLDGLIEQLALDNIILVGSSLGGNIAINYTAQNPHKVSHLVLQNSGGFRKANSRGGRGEDLPVWVNYLLYMLPKVAFDKFIGWMVSDESVLNDEITQQFHDGFRRAGNRYAEMQRIRQFKLGGTEQQLAQIATPVFIQWGEDNPQLPVALTEKFIQHLDQASKVETKIYSGVGHVLPIELPGQSAQDIIDFVLTDETGTSQ